MKVWVFYVGYAEHFSKNIALKDEWTFGLFMLSMWGIIKKKKKVLKKIS